MQPNAFSVLGTAQQLTAQMSLQSVLVESQWSRLNTLMTGMGHGGAVVQYAMLVNGACCSDVTYGCDVILLPADAL